MDAKTARRLLFDAMQEDAEMKKPSGGTAGIRHELGLNPQEPIGQPWEEHQEQFASRKTE